MHRSKKHNALAVLALLTLSFTALPAFAESYTVAWNPVTSYSDGTPLESGKSVSYTVYWSTDPSLSPASLKPIAAGTAKTSATFDPNVTAMKRGTTVYFTAKSTLSSGEESPLMAGVAWPVPRRAPGTPGGSKIIKL
jgi:hypothetical protein